jgi:hypothetical protein
MNLGNLDFEISWQCEGSTLKRGYIHIIQCTPYLGVFNLCQHFEISYSRYANKHYITGVYIAINDIYR